MYPGGINFWAELGVDKARGKWRQRKATRQLEQQCGSNCLKDGSVLGKSKKRSLEHYFHSRECCDKICTWEKWNHSECMWGKDQPMGKNWRKQDHREAGTVLSERGWSSGLGYWWGQRLPEEKVCRFLGFTKNLGKLDVEEEKSWLFY